MRVGRYVERRRSRMWSLDFLPFPETHIRLPASLNSGFYLGLAVARRIILCFSTAEESIFPLSVSYQFRFVSGVAG